MSNNIPEDKIEILRDLLYYKFLSYKQTSEEEDLLITPDINILNMLLRFGSMSFDDIKAQFDFDFYIYHLLMRLTSTELIKKVGQDRWELSDTTRNMISNIAESKTTIKDEIEEIENNIKVDPEIQPAMELSPIKNKLVEKLRQISELEVVENVEETIIDEQFNSDVITPSPLEEIEVTNPITQQEPISVSEVEINDPVEDPIDNIVSTEVENNVNVESNISEKEIEDLFDDILDTPLRSVMHDDISDDNIEPVTRSESISPAKEITKQSVDPLIEILTKHGYINNYHMTEGSYHTVSEYQILKVLIKKHPITTEEIEEDSGASSISLALSNLQSDRLIQQTNDYKWTISETLLNIGPESSIEVNESIEKGAIQEYRGKLSRDSGDEWRLKRVLHQLNYISSTEISEKKLDENHEIRIIRVVKNYGPISFNGIKSLCEEIAPVIIKRLITKLNIDKIINTDLDDNWQLSDDFIIKLVNQG
ncbi:MAG: hypothetical protein OEZ01_03470 [Candidatus Heimdallarchaeota archaeon]|nr:hypothetical protein [Candidatus Heimdallarchaeota archaeon]MDH5645037.1 hypothetical protein [Candidatus Heimdallarchaeota archaeon]